MGALNTKVDIDGQKVEDVVAEWMKTNDARWKGWVGK
jgi:glycine betaine/proline transport system substrate-binding protein